MGMLIKDVVTLFLYGSLD